MNRLYCHRSTCYAGTKVHLLTPVARTAPSAGVYALLAFSGTEVLAMLVQKYLLYWYKVQILTQVVVQNTSLGRPHVYGVHSE